MIQGYHINSPYCGRNKAGTFICVCGKCRQMPIGNNEQLLDAVYAGVVSAIQKSICDRNEEPQDNCSERSL